MFLSGQMGNGTVSVPLVYGDYSDVYMMQSVKVRLFDFCHNLVMNLEGVNAGTLLFVNP